MPACPAAKLGKARQDYGQFPWSRLQLRYFCSPFPSSTIVIDSIPVHPRLYLSCLLASRADFDGSHRHPIPLSSCSHGSQQPKPNMRDPCSLSLTSTAGLRWAIRSSLCLMIWQPFPASEPGRMGQASY
ncbi:uncharacterized protein LY79DRAFT_575141 [Colletotrichum navitas]|uniref:Uncharacterized protein n=1 Tax=Colletotrichum navitas TaxID=681940 RepID=A0AAD8QB50_9PEZI|nr:uncharacterized protein LY79DRAFT_575141 [Colletotrichum navitas]KAK1599438.1 hypothetical protein LY79DRAFT_575141 [Colletotrichum navitas]